VDALPRFTRDATDRNRTSPFAFTGNKFEFRMVGSSDSIACANIMLNAAVAQSLQELADELEGAEDFHARLTSLIRETIHAHKRIIFNGNGYDEAWIQEAVEVRGLANLRTTPDALPMLLDAKNMKMLMGQKVFKEAELYSRYEIQLENYCKSVRIEALTMVGMAQRMILPAVSRYGAVLAGAITSKQGVDSAVACGYERRLVAKLSGLAEEIDTAAEKLSQLTQQFDTMEDITREANFIRDAILPAMERLRSGCDEAEACTDASLWPFPTYGELLFGVN
jgi:glutamine synthetase